MSITAIMAAGYVTHSPAGEQMKPSSLSTLKALAFCTGEHSNSCYPSMRTLQEMTGHSVKTIRAALDTLEEIGFITRTHRVGTSNVYALQIDVMRAHHRRRRWTETRDTGNPYAGDHNAVTVVDEIPVEEQSVNVKRINFAEAPVEATEPPATEPVPAPVQAELIPAAPVKKTKKRSTTTAALDEAFNEFYHHVYPRKVEPLKARRAFEKAVKNGADPREIIEGARRFAAATAAKEVTYIPYPASWLNAGGWMSEAGDIAPVERTPWQAKTARMIQPVQAAAVVNNAPALTGAPATAPAAPLAIEPGYI
nr:MAG TPA: replisome organizer protein [Caudoviricetes sp.]